MDIISVITVKVLWESKNNQKELNKIIQGKIETRNHQKGTIHLLVIQKIYLILTGNRQAWMRTTTNSKNLIINRGDP